MAGTGKILQLNHKMIIGAAFRMTNHSFVLNRYLAARMFGQAANPFVVAFTTRLISKQIANLVRATDMMRKENAPAAGYD